LTQNVFLLIGVPVICSVILLPFTYAVLFFSKLVYGKFKTDGDPSILGPRFINPILAIFSLSLCAFFLRRTLASILIPQTVIILFVAVVIMLAALSVHKYGLRKLNIILTVLTFISIGQLLVNISFKDRATRSEWLYKNQAINNQIKFLKKPNVYFIVTESYPNRDALKTVYHIDNAAFYRQLKSNGFILYHNFYSNYKYSFSSLPSVFAMEHHYYQINLGNFDSIVGRSMIEANTYNPVVDTFKNNGYKIQYIHANNSLLTKGASVDFCSPTPGNFLALEVFLIHQNIGKRSIFHLKGPNFLNLLNTRISISTSQNEPYFSFFYIMPPGHSPSRWSTRSNTVVNKILSQFRKNYNTKIESANNLLIEIVKLIMGKDDDPLIIIAGDHGSWGYRFKEDANGDPIPDNLFILDRFGTLLGIRFPQDYSQNFDNEIKTHVNLFRYIFAYLSGNNNIINSKVPDDSYENTSLLAIKNGEILDQFQILRFSHFR
ncbi:hypothetical protein ACFL0O_11980, partial [Thermodesulfobacteriota bacterium]